MILISSARHISSLGNQDDIDRQEYRNRKIIKGYLMVAASLDDVPN